MPVAVLVLGTLTILYTIKGGMRAVVWTEIVQASVYMHRRLVGDGHRRASRGRRLGRDPACGARRPASCKIISWYTGFDQPHTMFAGLIGGAFLSMASHGADQLIVQRLLSARSLKGAQAAVIGSGVAVIIQFALFLHAGRWAVGVLRRQAIPDPRRDLPDVHRRPDAARARGPAAGRRAGGDDEHPLRRDQLARRGIDARHLSAAHRPGARRSADASKSGGSSRSSGASRSPAAPCSFRRTPRRRSSSSRCRSRRSRTAALLGGFFLAIFWRRAIQRDAILGMSVGIVAMSLIVFAKQISAAVPALAATLQPVSTIAYPWYVLIGTTITLFVGILSSLTHGAPAAAPVAARVETT